MLCVSTSGLQGFLFLNTNVMVIVLPAECSFFAFSFIILIDGKNMITYVLLPAWPILLLLFLDT